MCRSCDEGGRRCPGETAEKRRARQRGANRAKKAQANPVTVPAGTPAPTSASTTASGSAEAPAPGSAEAVAAAITRAREVLDNAGPMTTTGADGWARATEDGMAAEAAIRDVGEAVHARAASLAEGRAEQALRDHPEALVLNQHSSVTVPVHYESRDEYTDAVMAASYAAEDRKRDTAIASEEETKTATDMMKSATTQEERDEAMRRFIESIPKVPEEDKALIAERERIRIGETSWDNVRGAAYAEAYRETLAEQRGMGLPEGKDLPFTENSDPETVEAVRDATRYYPGDWLERDRPRMETAPIPEEAGGQGEYTGEFALQASVNADGDYSDMVLTAENGEVTGGVARLQLPAPDHAPGNELERRGLAVHEYGHRQETITPQVNEVCQAFLARRTTDEDGNRHPLQRMTGPGAVRGIEDPGPKTPEELEHRDPDEQWVRPDSFADAYTGRQYGDGRTGFGSRHSETFTTGVQSLFGGYAAGLRGDDVRRADPEHRNLILGALAAIR